MVDRGGGRHTYQAIAWTIREQIDRGELRPGDRVPGLKAIQERHHVSYATAQAAIGLLRSWGLVRTEQGTGTFVLPSKPVIELMNAVLITGTGAVHTWRETAEQFGLAGSQRVIGVGRAPAPPDVLDAFGYDADTPVAWRERLILANGDVVQITTSYYAAEVARAVPELGRPDRLAAWAPELMARAGWRIASGRDLAFARIASEKEAATLAIDVGDPVMEVLRTGNAADGTVIMVERMVSTSSRIRQAWNF